MTSLVNLPPELRKKLADIRAGRTPQPTTQPITTIKEK